MRAASGVGVGGVAAVKAEQVIELVDSQNDGRRCVLEVATRAHLAA
jgi:hypothetical protein